jgi:methionine sulfoxide reductase heme-binding subunit
MTAKLLPRPAAPARVASRTASAARLSSRSSAMLLAVLGLLVIYATGQILPAATDRQAELRFWLAARATGLVAFGLLTVQVVLGLVLSHPHNKTTWKLSRRIFPWHEHLWVFVMAFLTLHILALIGDPKSGVDVVGAVVPGMSTYRSPAVALGTLALYAFLVTALTARKTRLLPAGMWLSLHRLALVIFGLAWVHGMLAGTDSAALRSLYVLAGFAVTAAGAYRYWAARRARPTFSTSLSEAS